MEFSQRICVGVPWASGREARRRHRLSIGGKLLDWFQR